MNATDAKINYFLSRLEQVKKAEMEYKMVVGQFDKEFMEWLKEQGLPDRFSPIELIAHFRKKKEIEIL